MRFYCPDDGESLKLGEDTLKWLLSRALEAMPAAGAEPARADPARADSAGANLARADSAGADSGGGKAPAAAGEAPSAPPGAASP